MQRLLLLAKILLSHKYKAALTSMSWQPIRTDIDATSSAIDQNLAKHKTSPDFNELIWPKTHPRCRGNHTVRH